MTQYSFWRVQTVSRFPGCCYIHFAWKVFCSNYNTPVYILLQVAPNLLWRHLSVWEPVQEAELMNDHCRDLHLISTISILLLIGGWEFVFTFCIFSSVRDISRLTALIFSPRKFDLLHWCQNRLFPVDYKTQMLQQENHSVGTQAHLFYGVAH